MEVEINVWAVLLATLSSMVVGGIWYAPKMFGDKWARLVNLDDATMSKGAPKAMGIAVVASLVTAAVIAFFAYTVHMTLGSSFLTDSVITALALWAGIVLTRLVVHDAFEQRDWRITSLAVGNEFATILVMGLIIGQLPPAGI